MYDVVVKKVYVRYLISWWVSC